MLNVSCQLSTFSFQEFDFDVDALFEHLFATDSDVMRQIHESRKMLSKYNVIIDILIDGEFRKYNCELNLTMRTTIGKEDISCCFQVR